MSSELLQCYNRGCGKKYSSAENKPESCTYHPGEPYFHDAYKGWSCCKKRTVDFTEFLNTKGCAKGFHNNVKPPEPEKPKPSSPEEVTYSENRLSAAENTNRRITAPAPRPPLNAPMVELKPSVSASLARLLQQQEGGPAAPSSDSSDVTSRESGEPAPGTSCKHSGCQARYGSSDCPETCTYHSGVPIFHEGLKYWSCCQRKTSDFNTFLQQPGCASGPHLWTKPQETESEGSCSEPCRYDWHQTGRDVCLAVYAKQPRPELSRVRLGPVRLLLEITHGQRRAVSHMDLELAGVVDPSASSVQMTPSKVEMLLRKADTSSWSQLTRPGQVKVKPPAPPTEQPPPAIEQSVDALDLTDL